MAGIDQTIEDLADEFALLPDWEERISYVIELARALAPLSDEERNEENRIRGCASRVWLVSEKHADEPEKLFFRGDSDAHLVRGEVALLLRIFSGRTPADILSVEPQAVFERLGLKEALTMQRSNGLFSMMKRIQDEARAA
ncbi:MAG: SufE family protein [Hyphomonadaceae bacterium]|nr:SufE family protein [Hyphomonadaceae bacterium]MCA8885838.1 SufE family protein [Hyphomonadaceae bacterium]